MLSNETRHVFTYQTESAFIRARRLRSPVEVWACRASGGTGSAIAYGGGGHVTLPLPELTVMVTKVGCWGFWTAHIIWGNSFLQP